MQLTEFLLALKGLGNGWLLENNDEIRRYRNDEWECPVTAVANVDSGVYWFPEEAEDAATDALLLDEFLGPAIILAADDDADSGEHLYIPDELRRLREMLLWATGLLVT